MRPSFVRALYCCLALLAIFPIQSDVVRASSTTVVISEFRVRGPNGGNDEFIELYNASTLDQPIGGFKINGSNSGGTTSTRATITAGVTLRAGCYYLLTNSASGGYSGAVPGNQTYATGVTDDGGIALVNAANAIIDQVGMSTGSAYKEGTPLANLGTTNTARSYERKPGGAAGNAQDTDDNAADFKLLTTSTPQNATSSCIISTPQADAAPTVISTTPAAGATNVAIDSPIDITFSETVNATADAFTLECPAGSPTALTASASPNTSFRLTPNAALPFSTTCSLRVVATQVTDTDSTDPPDQMNSDFVLSFTTVEPPVTPSNAVVVISQIYGGGGNANAAFHNDFVELFNRGTHPQDLTGWSIQYASAGGDSWDNWQPLGGTMQPGEYLLIALASGGANGANLPPANINGQINMSATTGKVALVNSFALLNGTCPINDPSVVDFVGYGSGATCREGATNGPAPSNTKAILRADDGQTDTDRNSSDFTSLDPNPRRTAPIVELGPVLLKTDPVRNQINAPRDATLEMIFTEPVESAGNWFSLTCDVSGAHSDATFAVNFVSLYITPNTNFTPGEHCTVTIFKDQVHDVDTDDSQPNTDTLLADYTWTFSVAIGAAPVYPPSVHLTMGNPSGAVASSSEPNNYLMEKAEYALSYNRDFGRPNWVSWHLSDEWIGNLARVDTFRPDPAIPADWYRVQSFDFFSTGFDRGHMVPNADRDKDNAIPINQATFLMSNMLAQAPGNNQGPWADLEIFLRTLLPANELYIVAGGVGVGGSGSNGGETTTLANGHVTVPDQTWKAALVLPKGTDDVARTTCSARMISVLMPNDDNIRGTDWRTYLTTVDAIEHSTGYNLFANLPTAVQRCLEKNKDGEIEKNAPVFSGLAPATLEFGSAAVTFAGVIGVGDAFPSGQVVTVTFGSQTVNAPVGANGTFSATLDATGLALGAHPVSYSYAGDANFTSAASSSTLTVIDTTAPAINDVTATPGDLGVPNHKMVDVLVGYSATDLNGAPSCSLSVASNEAANALGDGNTSIDWRVVDPHHLQLRAERSGTGAGRIYTVTITCTDAARNSAVRTATVSVSK